MGEPHLHSVDSKGVVTPPPPPKPPNGSTTNPKRAVPKARPKYPVPTDRMKFETQVDALRTICSASRSGQETVNAERMAAYMRLAPTTATLNNGFFISLGLVEKIGKGDYKPSDLAVKFANKWSFDRDEAAKLLAPAFVDTWFFDAVKQKLAIGPTTRAEMIETFAGEANTDNSYAAQYGFLLEWLEFVGLIRVEDGNVRLRNGATAPVTAPPVKPEETPDTPPADIDITDKPKVAAPVVSLSVEIVVTADDLAQLSAEQIKTLFDGIGKVATVKEALKV